MLTLKAITIHSEVVSTGRFLKTFITYAFVKPATMSLIFKKDFYHNSASSARTYSNTPPKDILT